MQHVISRAQCRFFLWSISSRPFPPSPSSYHLYTMPGKFMGIHWKKFLKFGLWKNFNMGRRVSCPYPYASHHLRWLQFPRPAVLRASTFVSFGNKLQTSGHFLCQHQWEVLSGEGMCSSLGHRESWTVKKAERWRIDAFELQGDPTSPFWRRSALGFL